MNENLGTGASIGPVKMDENIDEIKISKKEARYILSQIANIYMIYNDAQRLPPELNKEFSKDPRYYVKMIIELLKGRKII